MNDSNDSNDSDIWVDYNWKPALTYLDKKGSYVIYTYGSEPLDTNYDIKNNIDTIEAFVGTFLDLNKVKEKYRLAPRFDRTEEQIYNRYADYLNVRAMLMSFTLVKYGLVTTEAYNEHESIHLTARGVDVALKLQEHEDNNIRFNQQSKFSKDQLVISESQNKISKALKKNSDRTVIAAAVGAILTLAAVLIGAFRLYQFEQKLVSHEDIDTRISELKKNHNSLALDNEKLKATIQLLKRPEVESEPITISTSEGIQPVSTAK
jgi:hypothetical protein